MGTTTGPAGARATRAAVDRVRHLRAARWVLRVLALQVAVLCLVALHALVVQGPLAALVVLAAAVPVLWLRHAFDRQRRWARDGLVVLAVLDLGVALLGTAPWRAAVPLLWLALLLHPDAREWVHLARGPMGTAPTTRGRP
ncbi:hypothetical protein [Klenkia sp. PcliD-1-E]|uniref:hypothetical protein n=1 Tax=Klenkia sp. PcliD-1-E TaxID=2954492 RepID=UPI0020980608|nr:hypothetical protein [Klenkia sp. PcliD-1-E]MCO7220337.1 hypothetical protein [Klenkia sp. PcliD-1-E]